MVDREIISRKTARALIGVQWGKGQEWSSHSVYLYTWTAQDNGKLW